MEAFGRRVTMALLGLRNKLESFAGGSSQLLDVACLWACSQLDFLTQSFWDSFGGATTVARAAHAGHLTTTCNTSSVICIQNESARVLSRVDLPTLQAATWSLRYRRRG